MAQRIPVNLSEKEKLDMLSGKPVKDVKFLTLEPAKVETEIIYRPSSTRRTLQSEEYAEEYRRREFEEYAASEDRKCDIDASSASFASVKLEELDGFSECDSKPVIELDVALDTDKVFKEVFELYSRYKFKNSFDLSLPICGYRNQILGMIDKSQVSIIQGGTGCGKSTQVCQFILEDAMSKGRHCNIVVTQPRKIAAISVARRVCSENGWPLGTICGYQVGLDKEASNDTRILFCTVGVLLQRLITTKRLDEFTHIILDEVHDRGQATDFCLLVIRKLMRSSQSNVKLLLMSATPDLPLYCDYLRWRSSPGVIVEPSVLRMVGRTFDVKELYLEDLYPGGQLPSLDEGPQLRLELMKMATKIITMTTEEEEKRSGSCKRGSVLVFLPGFEEIEDMMTMLTPHARDHRLELRRLHSAIPTEEQVGVFRELPHGLRKVILATNIAESSITVTDIKYVIDFCLTKSMIFDPTTNYSILKLQWASKGSCTQRKGRAGRVADGIVYRMIEHSTYQALKDFDDPEILTSPLDSLVLQSKLLDMGSPKGVLALALTPPDLKNIEKTILLLKEMGALSPLSTDLHDGDLTSLGRVMAGLPVATRLSKLIVLGHAVGLLEEAAIIAALHSVPGVFLYPSYMKLEAYHNKLRWANQSQSDSLANYYAFKAWEHLKSVDKFSTPVEETQWCRQHFLELKRLREVKVLYEELKKRLDREFNITLPRNRLPLDLQKEENRLLMKIVLCGAFYPNFFMSGVVDEGLASKGMGGHDHLRTVMVGGFPDGGGIFYKKSLVHLFRTCDPLSEEGNLKIFFDHTRAYVEFHGAEPTTAVCSALKMRSLRYSLEVDFDRSESALEEEEEEHEMEEEDEKTVAEGPRRVALPPPHVHKIEIRITHTVDCGHFWGLYADRERVVRSVRMHMSAQDWVSRNQEDKLKEFKRGTYCLAPFTDEDQVTMYYRAKILSRNDNNTIKVFFLDFGNQADIFTTQLFRLDPALLANPFQVMEFKLVDTKPSPLTNPGLGWVGWSREAKGAFEAMVRPHTSFCCEVFSIVDGVVRVRLFPSDDPRADIGRMLIARGFAEPCEESPPSKENNELRRRTPLKRRNPVDVYDDDDEPGVMNPIFERPRADRQRTLEGVLREKLAYKARYVKRMNLLKKVSLTGPVNLFELSFNPLLSFVGTSRVERNSVNSVVISTSPRPVLMTSAYIGINPKQTGLIVRESTVLPGILGLFQVVTLLFAPLAEYRCNKNNTEYIGALCGLGYYDDSSNDEPVFAEDDVELTFDFEFTFEDLKMINDIRVSINLMLGMTMVGSNLASIQATIRRKIFGLIHKRRKPQEAENFPRAKLWNQLPGKQNLVKREKDTSCVFVPHVAATLRCESSFVPSRSHETDEPMVTTTTTMNSRQRKEHHNSLLMSTNQYDLDQVFRCLVCNEPIIGTARLATHLSLASHRVALEGGGEGAGGGYSDD